MLDSREHYKLTQAQWDAIPHVYKIEADTEKLVKVVRERLRKAELVPVQIIEPLSMGEFFAAALLNEYTRRIGYINHRYAAIPHHERVSGSEYALECMREFNELNKFFTEVTQVRTKIEESGLLTGF